MSLGEGVFSLDGQLRGRTDRRWPLKSRCCKSLIKKEASPASLMPSESHYKTKFEFRSWGKILICHEVVFFTCKQGQDH